jgi:hypothetical protein
MSSEDGPRTPAKKSLIQQVFIGIRRTLHYHDTRLIDMSRKDV